MDPLQVRLECDRFVGAVALIHHLVGRERISQCFRFEIDVVVPAPNEIDFLALIGGAMSIVFDRGGEEVRRITGMLFEVRDLLETEAEYRGYKLVIVPRAQRLDLVTTQEAYTSASAPELAMRKLTAVGLGGAVSPRLTRTYGRRELVVQFRETDLAFISRSFEHIGAFFFFDQAEDKIVIGDSNEAFQPIPGAERVPFEARGQQRNVYRLEALARMTPACFFAQDYNYRTPQIDLVSRFDAPWAHAGGVVEYGTHHKSQAEGNAIAQVRAEARRVEDQCFFGESTTVQLFAGGRFSLDGHTRVLDRDLIVVEVDHEAEQPVLQGGGKDRYYKNRFRAIDAAIPYRAPSVTPKPRIHGVLTGIVEPRPDQCMGTIADLDDHGRYTVRFLFDASPPFGDRGSSSHRMRMIQLHAGADYGVHFPLKAGIEVLIVFVDGDPDRPLIVGCGPNPLTPSPVRGDDALLHRIKTSTGIIIEMKDQY